MYSKRNFVMGLAGLLATHELAGEALAQTFTVSPGPSAGSTTVIVKAGSSRLGRIAISPDGTMIAYVSGAAGQQKLIFFDLDDFKPNIFELDSVFVEEMMWASNIHIMLRLRLLKKISKNGETKFTQTAYIWRIINLTKPQEKPYYINARISDLNRVFNEGVFGLVYQNRINFAPPPERQLYPIGIPMPQWLNSDLDVWALEDRLIGGVPLLSDSTENLPNPYDAFEQLDLDTKTERIVVKLNALVRSYTIRSDGEVLGYSTFDEEERKSRIYFKTEARGKSKYKKVYEVKTSAQDEITVAGVGQNDDSLILAQRTDEGQVYSQIGKFGDIVPINQTGTPIFDAYSHRLVGFMPNNPPQQPVYYDAKWSKIWEGLLKMNPANHMLKVESHAMDARKLILSINDLKGGILYYFADLSNGRTELLTRNADAHAG